MRDPLDTSIGPAPFYSVAENTDNRNGVSEPAVSHGRISQVEAIGTQQDKCRTTQGEHMTHSHRWASLTQNLPN